MKKLNFKAEKKTPEVPVPPKTSIFGRKAPKQAEELPKETRQTRPSEQITKRGGKKFSKKQMLAALAALCIVPALLAGIMEESTEPTQIPDQQEQLEITREPEPQPAPQPEAKPQPEPEAKPETPAEPQKEVPAVSVPVVPVTPAPDRPVPQPEPSAPVQPEPAVQAFSLSQVPAFSGSAYVPVNGNVPYFQDSEITDRSFEQYAALDSLGRCGVAVASIGQDLMPTEERGSIGQVKPSGWHTVKYDCVDGKYLYNRCHLIGFQLSGENANTRNLITGTRYLNIKGMLPFENMVADYVKETNHHVMYRVTPVFEGSNLLAAGVLMEGYSVEDEGDGVCFCVFAYNEQPGVTIDHASGDSALAGGVPAPQPAPAPVPQPQPEAKPQPEPQPQPETPDADYIINISSGKFHKPSCSSVDQMNESNKEYYKGSREDLIDRGYSPCKRCNP